MQKTLIALLFLLPSCSEMSVTEPPDGSGSDAGTADATLVDAFGSDVPAVDAAAPDDAPLSDGSVVDAGSAMADGGDSPDDAGGALIDAGRDAGMSTSTAECGDGYVDPPETCDPAYTGGMHSSVSCPVVGAGACSWCRWGLLSSGGCLYGDYMSDPRSPGWSSACRDSARNDLSWVVWHSAAERDEVVAAYRTIGATTDVSGWIGYSAPADGMPMRWIDDGSTMGAATLEFRNTRTTGRNCVTLTVTPTEAYLRYESCFATTIHGLCVTQPWGAVR